MIHIGNRNALRYFIILLLLFAGCDDKQHTTKSEILLRDGDYHIKKIEWYGLYRDDILIDWEYDWESILEDYNKEVPNEI